jgi:thiosulfate/3-mercaptopyruvate sulfurtransferase
MKNAGIADEISVKGYAHPARLVSTSWLAEHLDDPGLRILESDEDVLLYDIGHIPNAQKIDWYVDLNDRVQRDYVSPERFQAVLRARGIDESTPVVLYGDKNNWWATYALWVFELFGFTNVRILDGGRMKWEMEERPMTTAVPKFPPSEYCAPARDDTRIRVFFDQARAHLAEGGKFVDVRSPQEYTGERTHMPEYPQEGTLRAGHIPSARSIPWASTANTDGSFRSADELRRIYEKANGLSPADDVVTYCRIGERSSHSWFVLTYLLGYPRVRNYDGSWTEWGNAVRAPIKLGAEP